VNRVFDSSGPEGKVRGTPQQIIEKYTVLARDAQLSGDRINAENFAQHAEHYQRLLGEAQREAAERQKAQDEQRERQAKQRAEEEESTEQTQAGGETPSMDTDPMATDAPLGSDDVLVVDTPEAADLVEDAPKVD